MTSFKNRLHACLCAIRCRKEVIGIICIVSLGAGAAAFDWISSPRRQSYRTLETAPWTQMSRVEKSKSELTAYTKQIDELIQARLDELDLQACEEASDEVFVRRVYLDTLGRIPRTAETTAFLNSSKPNKRQVLIDDLLASDEYLCHYFNFFADLLRLKSQIGHHWAGAEYGEWLKQSLRINKPFDQFVYDLLVASGHAHQNGAVGYWIRDNGMLADSVSNTMQAFLGTRVECAECHDDPYSSLTRNDYMQLSAYFSQVRIRRGRRPRTRGSAFAETLVAKAFPSLTPYEADRRQASAVALLEVYDRDFPFEYPENYQYSDAQPGDPIEPALWLGVSPRTTEGRSWREAFARWVIAPENSRFSKTIANRLWAHVMGEGVIEPVDDLSDGTCSNDALLDLLGRTIREVDFDIKSFLRVILNSRAYQRENLGQVATTGEPHHYRGALLRRMSAEQIWDSLMILTVPDISQRRGYGSAIIHSRDALENVRTMSAISFRNWLRQPLFLDAAERRKNPAHVAPFIIPDDVARFDARLWAWDMTGAVDPKWKSFDRELVRASELESPAPAGHLLRTLGQSDRETIEGAASDATLQQVLALMNDDFHDDLWKPGSPLSATIGSVKTPAEKSELIYKALLSRRPDADELAVASDIIQSKGESGLQIVVWSLINSTEFLFIQ